MYTILSEHGTELPMTETSIAVLALGVLVTVGWMYYLYR